MSYHWHGAHGRRELFALGLGIRPTAPLRSITGRLLRISRQPRWLDAHPELLRKGRLIACSLARLLGRSIARG